MQYQERHRVVLRQSIPDYQGNTVWQTSEDFNRANSSWWVVAVPVVVVLIWVALL